MVASTDRDFCMLYISYLVASTDRDFYMLYVDQICMLYVDFFLNISYCFCRRRWIVRADVLFRIA